MTSEFKIIPHGSSEWKEAVDLRENVLRKPLGSFFSVEELEAEKEHIHVIGLYQNKVVATAVLVPEGKTVKMQRVAVEVSIRNMHIGSKMMAFCEDYCINKGYHSIYCHARESAINFYLNNGYSGEGNSFNEDGIPHLRMKKLLR